MFAQNNIFRLFSALIAVALINGCAASLPFRHEVIPVIPDHLRIKGAHATAYAINDSGHVLGIYWPPAPRNGDQIFIFANGHLTLQDYPCNGYIYANIITATGMIAGHCQRKNGEGVHSFVLSYAKPDALLAIQPVWPTEGYIVSGLNDRGDAIGWIPDAYRSTPVDVLGFIYVAGQLHMVRQADFPSTSVFSNSVLNQSGLVLGGERARRIREIYPFMFAEGKFAETPSIGPGSVKAVNSSGHYLVDHEGPGFGIWDGQYREIDCGKEWCNAKDINDQGWVVGNRLTTYSLVPPASATFGHTFLWMNDRFYSIDNSVGMTINTEYPVKLSNEGHILFHSGGWPYLLTPEGLPKQAPQRFSPPWKAPKGIPEKLK
jgi:hypothetical protein